MFLAKHAHNTHRFIKTKEQNKAANNKIQHIGAGITLLKTVKFLKHR